MDVLHLVGSCVSDFYFNLSVIYAKGVVQPKGIKSYYAVVNPDNLWQLGASLDSLSKKISLQDMISGLPKVDLVVPHMFCFPGMTVFRAFFEDMLGLPLVGSSAQCTTLATNKSHTKSIVAEAGVTVAKAQQIRKGDTNKVTMELPFIVKPTSEDNSNGMTFVQHEKDIKKALQTGFEFDDVLLIEDYIPGRELRVAVIERDGTLYVPSMIEYLCTSAHPVRTVHDKLELKSNGMPGKQPDNPQVKSICPAVVESKLFNHIATAAKLCHMALGCRDYSLYDFRVHSDTNEPYLLEAGLFWSFSKISMISKMLLASGENLEDLVLKLWSTAAGRKRIACGALFKHL